MSVWTKVKEGDTDYVQRCSHCGRYWKELRKHWFYTGLYCVACIQDVLYDNAYTVDEKDVPSIYFNPHGAEYEGEVG